MDNLLLDLIALVLAPLFFVLPGYGIGLKLNLLDFNAASTSVAVRLALSILFSLMAVPATLYLVARATGLEVATGIFVALDAVILIWQRKSLVKPITFIKELWNSYRGFLIAAAIWTVIGLASISDLQVGHKLYNSVCMFDWVKHIAVTDGIRAHGLPPVNFFVSFEQPVKLFYYYFWYLMPAAVSVLMPPFDVINTRPAITGCCLWTGYGLMCLLLVYAKYMVPEQASRKVLLTLLALMSISGLQAVWLVLIDNMAFGVFHGPLYQTASWWCSPMIPNCPNDMIWVPQHITSVIAGLMGSLILWRLINPSPVNHVNTSIEANGTSSRSQPNSVIPAIMAGVGFASAAGCSIFATIPLVAVWGFWLVVWTIKKRFVNIKFSMIAGVVSALVIATFVVELLNSRQSNVGGYININVGWIYLRPGPTIMNPWWLVLLIRPLIYFVWLGAYVLPCIYYWRLKLNSKNDAFNLSLVTTGMLISFFVHSMPMADDLGMRAHAAGRVVILLWSAITLCNLRFKALFAQKIAMVFIAMGLFTTVYDLGLMRTYCMFYFKPEIFYERALMYDKLNHLFSRDARFESNPNNTDFLTISPFLLIYGHHQTIEADKTSGIVYGIAPRVNDSVVGELRVLFEKPAKESVDPQNNEALALAVCKKYKIDVVIVCDKDSIWKAEQSWMIGRKPLLDGEHFKAFQMSDAHLRLSTQ